MGHGLQIGEALAHRRFRLLLGYGQYGCFHNGDAEGSGVQGQAQAADTKGGEDYSHPGQDVVEEENLYNQGSVLQEAHVQPEDALAGSCMRAANQASCKAYEQGEDQGKQGDDQRHPEAGKEY